MTSPPASVAPAADRGLVDREPARELGLAFKGVLASVRRLRGRETRSVSCLSDAQYGLLFGLRDQDEVSAGELATLADLSPASTTQMLDALEAAGLVRRERSLKDRRVVLTSLTERGHALLEERHARIAPRWNAALAQFSDDELRTAAAVLDRIRGVFDTTTPGG
ncbi:MAG: MarR family winged helix-turn-helix transcriptional regulator [Solirubrobacteraceae bacterium]